jgi:alkylmercury lyase
MRFDDGDLERLAEKLVGDRRLSPEEQRIAVAVYRLLTEGKPVSEARLAQEVMVPEGLVRETLNGWWGIFRDSSTAVIAFWGLALPKMPHRFEVDGRTLHTWCAWDTLFIPQILEKRAQITSSDPITRQLITLVVSPERVESVGPSETILSFVEPGESPFGGDVIMKFCHFIHFFSSPESATEWRTRHTNTFLLSLEDAFRLGQLTNRMLFKDALQPSGV